ncbi:hypothetical protein [Streptomyces sp. NBC_01235]|uniref:hypothetical protein n=1 Tax=Streptomyces sp. NBC_01235 TaxID=2903788 RepID=UPI002E1660D8|nr:hypothetical protein OG289_28675 [Streptomyces sp. NBC_01235]
MTGADWYATRPDRLPTFVKNALGTDARPEVLLDRAEARALEDKSLNRFPPTLSSGIDWDSTTYQRRLKWSDEAHWAAIAADLLAEQVAAGKRVALLWGDLTVPTVLLPAELVVAHAEEGLLADTFALRQNEGFSDREE